jgi:hypothetical protein
MTSGGNMKPRQMTIPVDERDWKRLKDLLKREGRLLSIWVRDAILEKLEKSLNESVTNY